MIITEEWIDILDEAERLSEGIVQSDVVCHYIEAKRTVYEDAKLVEEIDAFNRMKERYEEVQRFGRYHPDYKEVTKQVRQMKRALDLNDKVAQLRLAESDVQQLLDEVSVALAEAVSPAVHVDTNNPFFETGCSTGGCSSGGACNCSA